MDTLTHGQARWESNLQSGVKFSPHEDFSVCIVFVIEPLLLQYPILSCFLQIACPALRSCLD
uniref:Uncharacterized protein n=1 Tax=Oryzias latipes TaxID=8090 RepID=A0A3P9MJ65_ORYLA